MLYIKWFNSGYSVILPVVLSGTFDRQVRDLLNLLLAISSINSVNIWNMSLQCLVKTLE